MITIEEAIDGRWMILVNGVQWGAPYDHTIGCGTATFATKAEAQSQAQRLNPTTTEEHTINGYIAIYNSRRVEVYAESLYAAKVKALKALKVPKSKQGLLTIALAEKDGAPIAHSTASIG